MLIYFSIFNSFLCASPVTSFLVLTTVLHYVKSVRIRNYFDPHFSRIFFPHSDWIRRDTLYPSVFSSNTGKCVKNADQSNSEYGHSLRSVTFLCASLIIVTVRQGIQALSVDHSAQLPSSISLCIIRKGLICIVIFLFFCLFYVLFQWIVVAIFSFSS